MFAQCFELVGSEFRVKRRKFWRAKGKRFCFVRRDREEKEISVVLGRIGWKRVAQYGATMKF